MVGMSNIEIRHAHLFCGLGGGAAGFNDARPVVGSMRGQFRCIGGIDVDPAGIRDFQRLTGVAGTVMDMFDRDQYRAFHGREPGPEWHEAMPADIRRAFGGEHPHIVFLSAPCKGFSGLLSEGKSKTDRYQALNRLTLRGVWLMLEAYKNDPVELILFENVPRIATRGRHLLDQIVDLLRAYGYAVAETTHDCGELGGLAQSRKRFLLVARHIERVPPFLYQPDRKPLRAVGDILGRMPLPGDARAGGMHRVPSLQWKTWVRLAFVEAGSDWRSLNRLEVEDGKLRDYLIVPEFHHGYLGVQKWDGTSGTVAGRSSPSNGAFSVQDPRFDQSSQWNDGQAYGVRRWEDTSGAIAGQQNPGQGAYSVADPRHGGPAKHSNEFRIVEWDRASMAVTSAHGSGQAVADPRPPQEGRLFTKYPVSAWEGNTGTVIGGDDAGAYGIADPRAASGFLGKGKYRVTGFNEPAGTVISGSTTGQGAFAVADPRSGMDADRGAYLTGGHYGVVPWEGSSGAVSSAACHDSGRWSVADPRVCDSVQGEAPAMPAPADKLVCRIQALDGTWHRPFTTLELAALQSLLDPEDAWVPWRLDGESDQAWRERIGNAVPRHAARAVAEVMGETLMLAWSGETFQLSARPVWVRPLVAALSLPSVRG